ncbi:PDDEXK-like family protein [Polaribacter septentrionalilitoris]|uniref:PDDEXK-like family protein n=1 Tax=Polaribacter septentrionalilitoris TaxID=2494657 RepID=UPI00135B9A85|nr:PD-(D/E)XK nuclease family protein [Polaribacter septentrionalilitoris]
MINLLKKVELINYKYSLINAENEFNIFEILRDKSDEVHLHSQFIYELLRNNGNHKFGSEITNSLLEVIGIIDFDLDSYSVHKEYKNIDILIKNDKQAIIIENKIWAEDQNKQLERYNEIITIEGFKDIYIYYLTPFGKEPSKESLGTLKLQSKRSNDKTEKGVVNLISYSFHILSWLENCIGITAKNSRLRETVIQYQDLINNITGKSSNMEQRLEIYKLLSEDNNIESALTIAQNWIHIKWHTEWDFWNYFEEKIKSENYIILDEQKFSKKNLNSVIHQARNKNFWYGLKFELSEYKNEKVYLMIQRGFGQLIYGIKTVESNVEELSELINGYCEFNVMQNWCCRNHFIPSINFEDFSNKATLHLSNEKVRKERINEYWLQIKGLIEHYEKIITVANNV